MTRAGTVVGLLLASSGLLILAYSFVANYLLHWLVAALVFSSGVLFITQSRRPPVSVFVCGECHSRFLSELDLRQHYVRSHTKGSPGKGSN